MNNSIKKPAHGFTFIELVLALTILGVIGVMAIPEYVEAARQALVEAKWQKTVTVKNTFTAVTKETKTFPAVAELASQLRGEGVKAMPGGIELMVDDEAYIIPTYANDTCTTLTNNVQEKVQCVGTIL